ncbi:C40 family peptidase [Blastococcus sp. VKM Ac-2987]|uniref:C40 family peptidase n=1 Tax=Blastococcus sp. VKM Ac-2987 TaxID=3004141 RepID=UPI0022AB5238|nr:C40 family peptidase [Blastococcus sp. VKM Ac-2987]MCZ2860281.1 C40 family peptidase [Blastococcus sp. VKM Ac-2987]
MRTVRGGTGSPSGVVGRHGGRQALRTAVTLLVAAVAIGLTPSPAGAAPRNPSDAELGAAERAEADAATRVGEIGAQLARARAGIDAAHQAALIAQQDYEDKQAAYDAARTAADAAAAAAVRAAADLQHGRDDVASFARASYMQGSTAPGITALLSSGGPAELIERSALLDAAGVNRTEVVAELTVLEAEAETAEQLARETAEQAETVQQQAAELLASAQSHELSARSQADALAAQEDGLQAELAQAQQALDGLEGARAAAQEAAARPAPAPVAAPAPAPAPAPVAAPERTPARPAPAPVPVPVKPTPVRPDGGTAGAPSTSAVATAIAAARSQLGVPYSWGGGGSNGPSNGIAPDTQIFGFDCSGLTQYAYARAGIAIGGTSRDQWWLNRTKQVATGDLRPGDLLFWGGDRDDYMSITHVAIYIGGGQMIEAPDRGEHVTVARVRTSSSTYFGAVRPSA